MKVLILASGSQGNAILVQSQGHSLLIDFGISVRKFKLRLRELKAELGELEAIFISHEHTDHIAGLKYISNKIESPIFATEGSWERLFWLKVKNPVRIRAGDKIKVNNFEVQPFRVPHDAGEPVGFVIEAEGKKIAIVTDLGSVNHLIRERLKGAELVILESNHDPELLLNGPYPWPLKQRIMSREGHLSNQDCARLLREIQDYGLASAVLAHLSLENNTPELAYQTSRELLNPKIGLYLTSQKRAGPSIQL